MAAAVIEVLDALAVGQFYSGQIAAGTIEITDVGTSAQQEHIVFGILPIQFGQALRSAACGIGQSEGVFADKDTASIVIERTAVSCRGGAHNPTVGVVMIAAMLDGTVLTVHFDVFQTT